MSPQQPEQPPSSSLPEPIITTPLVIIRRYSPADAPALQRIANDPEVSRHLSSTFPYPYTLADAEFYLDNIACAPDSSEYAIVRASDGALAGGMKCVFGRGVFSRTCEIGYMLGRESWGKGLATAATVALSRWAFETNPDLVRVEADVFEPNVASARVLEKAGFKLDGTKPQAAFKHGVVMDVKSYSLLRDECLASTA